MAKSGLKLIVVSGLPGSGKSSVAESISTVLSLPVVSVDPIEAAMWRSGLDKQATGIAAYEVAAAIAEAQLKIGLSVVIDAVNPVEAAREHWRRLEKKYGAKLLVIETICSDESLHKERIEKRLRRIEGMDEVTWSRVLERKSEYTPWPQDHLVLDSVEPLDKLSSRAIEFILR